LPAQPDPDAELIELGARLEPVIKNAELLAIGEEMKPLIAEWIDLLPQRARLHKRVLRGAGTRHPLLQRGFSSIRQIRCGLREDWLLTRVASGGRVAPAHSVAAGGAREIEATTSAGRGVRAMAIDGRADGGACRLSGKIGPAF
jgi:hypothetical protein